MPDTRSRLPVTLVQLSVVLLTFASANVAAQLIQPSSDALAEMDAVINGYLEENNIPGALVAVASRGEIVDLRNYGMPMWSCRFRLKTIPCLRSAR